MIKFLKLDEFTIKFEMMFKILDAVINQTFMKMNPFVLAINGGKK